MTILWNVFSKLNEAVERHSSKFWMKIQSLNLRFSCCSINQITWFLTARCGAVVHLNFVFLGSVIWDSFDIEKENGRNVLLISYFQDSSVGWYFIHHFVTRWSLHLSNACLCFLQNEANESIDSPILKMNVNNKQLGSIAVP